MLVTRVTCHVQHWLWEVLVWLMDEEGEKTVKTIVNEESEDEDEGYNSIAEGACKRRGRKLREADMKFIEEDTKDELKEKLFLLKEAYDDLKDEITRLEFEVDYLKDELEEKEEEMRAQRTDLQHCGEQVKVMQKEKEGDKDRIRRQQEIIDNWARESSGT